VNGIVHLTKKEPELVSTGSNIRRVAELFKDHAGVALKAPVPEGSITPTEASRRPLGILQQLMARLATLLREPRGWSRGHHGSLTFASKPKVLAFADNTGKTILGFLIGFFSGKKS
jgi:hypothetical protein